jgi:KUP system potassium uptake protein
MFQTSSKLAHAYGVAVTTTMVVDGLLGFMVIWRLWKWDWWKAALLMVPLVALDGTFLSANLLKLFEGAWLPLLFGIGMVLMIITWQRGSRILIQKTRRVEVPLESLIRSLERRPPHIVHGTAVFLTSDPDFAPASLLHNLKHNKVLHEQNVILRIITADTPRATDEERVQIEPISERFTRVSLKFGFMEPPNVPKALAVARKKGLQFDIMSTSFFLSRRSLKPAAHSGMPAWQDRLFIGLARSANDATDFFQIPTGRVVEVGTQVTV